MPANSENRVAFEKTQGGEYQEKGTREKRARNPKKSRKKGKPVMARGGGHRSGTRNGLYALAAEFRRNQPGATAADAWKNFSAVAAIGAHNILLRYDATADVLEYRPDPEKFATREVRFASFERRWRCLCAS